MPNDNEELLAQKEKEIAALKAEIAALKAKIAPLEADEVESKKNAERTTTLESELAKTNTELAKAQAEVGKMQQGQRLATIRTFVAEQKRQGKILPRWEPKVIALLDSADETQVRVFTEKDEKGTTVVEKKMTQRQLVEALLTDMPQLVSFKELTPQEPLGETEVPDAEVGAKIRQLIAAYKLEHPEVPHDKAFKMVLDAHPALKAQYAGEAHLQK